MAKKLKSKLKLHIKAGQASPAPPIGPMIAEQGVNIQAFCQRFNDETSDKGNYTIPVLLKVYEDGSWEFELSEPVTSELLKEEAGIKSGSGEPNVKKVATITRDQLKKVAKRKLPDLNTDDIEQAMKIVRGTADSMGIQIE